MTQPNILFLMIDGAPGHLFRPNSPVRKPNLDRLAQDGVRIEQACSVNPICSPARASLMTGLLPHNHGVWDVIHSVADDQSCLRTEHPHWAERLVAAGYRTGYFGKWHIERSNDLTRFGWQVNGSTDQDYYRDRNTVTDGGGAKTYSPSKQLAAPAGYKPNLLYGADATPLAQLIPGKTVAQAGEFLTQALAAEKPWCCMVSLPEPNEPPICGRAALDLYDIDATELPATQNDEQADKPGLYAKAAGLWSSLTTREKKELIACQYAAISEIDTLYGNLIDQVKAAGQWDNTIVVFTSDHGNLLGAHGLLGHNVSAYEENYRIPLILRGPGLARNASTAARVSLHAIGPTLLELAGVAPLPAADAQSFAALLKDPAGQASNYTTAYAEYFGARYLLTQRVLWDGDWKLAFNGFDHDELYNRKDDPLELRNLARDPAHRNRLEEMMRKVWARVRDNGDKTLFESHWPGIRFAVIGPLSADPA